MLNLDMDKNAEKAKRIVLENQYMAVATSDGNNPWSSPLYYSVDEFFNFYFVTSYKSRHSKNLRVNPRIALSIYNSTLPPDKVDGVKIEGTANKVSILEFPKAALFYFRKRFGDPKKRKKSILELSKYSGIGLHRLYKIIPTHVYTLASSHQNADKRVEVFLS